MRRLVLAAVCLLMLMGQIAHSDESKNKIKVITDYYRCYLDFKSAPGKKITAREFCDSKLPFFSASMKQLIEQNHKVCKAKANGEICGFDADGDPFLDAQDIGDTLNFKTSKFKAVEIKKDIVQVIFDLFPETPGRSMTKIKFKMVKTREGWRVEDVIYPHPWDGPNKTKVNETSMSTAIRKEIEDLNKSP